MKTSIELPDNLLLQAMRAARVKTRREVVTLALEELIKKSQSSTLKKYKGKINLDINLDELRGR